MNKLDNEIIQTQNIKEGKIDTDVDGVLSDGYYQKGFEKFPVFNITEKEFFDNMLAHRQRCRFTTPKVVEYMQKTRYKKPFYVQCESQCGKKYVRKVK